MHSKWTSLVALVTVLLLAVSSGCKDDSPSSIAPDNAEDVGIDRGRRDVVTDTACPATLDFVSDPAPMVMTSGTVDLTVGYADCDQQPIANAHIAFAIEGEAADSQLMSQSALTDAEGIATVTLRTGAEEARFQVVVSTEGAASIAFDVTVTANLTGTIEVVIRESASPGFDAFRASLHADRTCGALDPFALPEAFQSAPSIPTSASHPLFTGVPVGSSWAVVVLADVDGAVLGWGCTDAVEVAGGQTTETEVFVAVIPILFTGVYELDNRFDLSGVLPPSVSTTLQVLDEMTDDHDLYGDDANESFGLDPAAFLLDFVYRQFCCWEALDADPGTPGFQGNWDTCIAQDFQHPYGDLSDLYLEDFMTWDGAQPIYMFLCGSLDAGANEIVQQEVQDLILSYTPDVLLRLLDIAGDLSRVFTEMHIMSELTVNDVSVSKEGNFTHRLRTLIVELHDLDGVLHTYPIDLLDAGLTNLSYTGETTATEGNRLTIPAHSFRLDFGRLLRYVYLEALLPNLDCDPDGDGLTSPCTDTADLFGTWINCADAGLWLETNVGFLDAWTYQDYCETGLSLAGLYVENQMAESIDAETVITIAGECEAGEINERREATRLSSGTWDGTLEEDSSTIGEFDGTFVGRRLLEP